MKEHPNYKYRPRRKPKSLVSKMESSGGGGGGYGPPGSPHHPGLAAIPGLSGLPGLPRLLAPSPCPPPRHADPPPHGFGQGLGQGLGQGFSPGALLSRVGALFPPLPYPLYPHLQHLHKVHADDLQASGKIADLAWQVRPTSRASHAVVRIGPRRRTLSLTPRTLFLLQALYSSSLYSQAAASLSWPPPLLQPPPHPSPCGVHCGCGAPPSPPLRRSPLSSASPLSARSPTPPPDVKRPIPFLASLASRGRQDGGILDLEPPRSPDLRDRVDSPELVRIRTPPRAPPYAPQHVI